MRRWSLIVLGTLVIALLVVFTLPLTQPLDANSKPIKARYGIDAVETGLRLYRNRFGAYPSEAEGLASLESSRILLRVSPDPWGNHYHYRCPGAHHPDSCDVWSYGADGREGGSGYDRDVTNWDQ